MAEISLDELLAREAIKDLMARYTMAGDRLQIEDFVACFTSDGIIESERVSSDRLFRYEGREAIRAWQQRWLSGGRSGEGQTHNATFVRHHLTTSKIDFIDEDTAKACTYWTAWTDIGPDHAGYYLDTLRKVSGSWLIAHRRVRMDWEAGSSLFKSAILSSQVST